MATSKKPKRYRLKLREEPVEIEDHEGKPRIFTLRELDGSQRDEYVEVVRSRSKFGPDGKLLAPPNESGLQPLLLSKCLRDEKGVLVSFETIAKWPASQLEGLFEEAVAVSGLGKEAAEAEGNA